MDKMAVKALEAQRAEFVKKFGREPRANDPIFFDPDAPGDEPVAMTEEFLTEMMTDAMERAGTAGHLVYAFKITGLMLTEATYRSASRQVRRQWDRAIARYFDLHPDEDVGGE